MASRLPGRALTRLGSAAVLAAACLLLAPAAAARHSQSGGIAFIEHTFPVLGPHWARGAVGEFGAPRSGGRVHEGFDIVAPCGARLVAARGGRVLRRGHDPVLYGNYLLIHGAGEPRSYFYSHLIRSAAVRRGQRLWTGQPVGAVGATGNARTVGCHLHFEIRARGQPIDPVPPLSRWDRRD